MRLEEIEVGQRLDGLRRGGTARVEVVTRLGPDSVQVIFSHEGEVGQLLLTRADEGQITGTADTARAFDAPAADYRLALEARRISLAGRFDPMLAVTTSDVRPLPHQIRAVYGLLLEQMPLRFLLADDPGAGKTIMAGLYAKELMLRGDVSRCLIVAPGGLVEQWQEELRFKFDLRFEIFGAQMSNDNLDANVFEAHPLLICRMDQLSRNERLMEQLAEVGWDLTVVDEAHRMSASYFAGELKRTKRFALGELLGRTSRHLLLMTATPHTGLEADFQQFLTLLDRDRFEGRYREGMPVPDTSTMMRRMLKEEMLTFEGRPLFPERIAQTVPYEMSPLEAQLYEEVTGYVREEMNRAEALDGRRRSTVGFALTVLQRRLASSPEAIHRSLERRLERLRRRRLDVAGREARVRDDYLAVDADQLADEDEFSAEEIERLESELVDAASASQTVEEVDHEIAVVAQLLELSTRVRAAGTDRKWGELLSILDGEVLAWADGSPRKLIVFTEHRDTLGYLERKVRGLLGRHEAVVSIHGGVRREERRRITAEFTSNPDCQVLIATDAAGEGLNLQAAHLMVNYDLPWNPNRIDQRFGRIHRIGQTRDCRLWNLVAIDTREGEVYRRLLEKLEVQAQAYGGRVFEVLGRGFADRPLRELLMEAILRGEDPQVRARMEQVIDETVSVGLPELIGERALAREALGPVELERLRAQMDEATSRRLQPFFIERFFRDAFRRLGGRLGRRESGRFEISHVPARLRADPKVAVSTRYERVAFAVESIAPAGLGRAELLAPGHPLFDQVVAQTLADLAPVLERGATFVGEVDEPRVLLASSLSLADGLDETLLERFGFAWAGADGRLEPAGSEPHLDLVAADGDPRAAGLAREPWVAQCDASAVAWFAERELPELIGRVADRREAEIDRAREQITARLGAEINRLYTESLAASERQRDDRAVRQSADALRRRAEELEARREARLAELAEQRRVRPSLPRVLTSALVLPLDAAGSQAPQHARRTEEVERRAVDAVLAAERALGRSPVEQARNNPGFDILSGRGPEPPLFIEVKGRIEGAEDFSVTATEVLFGKNNLGRHVLALVRVDPRGPAFDEVRYLRDEFAGVDLAGMENSRVVNLWEPTWAKAGEPS